MLSALQIDKKNYTLSTFPSSNRRNFEDPGKVLATSVFEFFQSIAVQLYQPTVIRWLPLLIENTIRGTRWLLWGKLALFPKTQVVVPVYDKMASIMPHS